MQGIYIPCVFIFNQYIIMITAKNGKRYLTSDDVMELVYNCKLTKKLDDLQRRAENHYLNKEESASKETMISELQEIIEISDKKWSELITPGLYASSKEYDDVKEHYLKLRGECWKTLALILNYSTVMRCLPVDAWL